MILTKDIDQKINFVPSANLMCYFDQDGPPYYGLDFKSREHFVCNFIFHMINNSCKNSCVFFFF